MVTRKRSHESFSNREIKQKEQHKKKWLEILLADHTAETLLRILALTIFSSRAAFPLAASASERYRYSAHGTNVLRL